MRPSSSWLPQPLVVASAMATVEQHGPRFVPPMAAKLVTELPAGDWIYEVKLDGYRCLALKRGSAVQLRSRRDKDLGKDYPHVVEAVRTIKAETATLDGEIVALDPQGRPAFQLLQNRARIPRERIVFFAFDLLHLDGEDLTGQTVAVRKEKLASVVKGSRVQLSQNLPGRPGDIVDAVRKLGLEGVIAKRRASRYEAGRRSGAWVKLKLNLEQEFAVGGYKPSETGFESLLVGVYDKGSLRFAGKVRAGLTPHLRRQLWATLRPLASPTCPFADLPTTRTGHWGEGVTAEDMNTLRWVQPTLVVQVSFVEWPEGGLLRHASFVGMRADKRVEEAIRDMPRARRRRADGANHRV